MTIPHGLLGAGLVFWGWQTGNLLFGIPLALFVEALRWSAFRLQLRHADLARIADLCTVLFLGLTALLAANRGIGQGVLSAFQWLPVVLAPVLLSQLVSPAGRIPLSALFRYLRKQRQRDPSIDDPPVDLGGVYLALCVISAGAANVRGPGYYAGLIAVGAWALFAVRPRHSPLALWIVAFLIASAGGYAGQAGLTQLQASLEGWVSDWQLRGMDADPYRSTTDIGSIGRLKLLDAIVLRVYADQQSASRLKLLHRASFTTYSGTTWSVRKAPMVPVEAGADGGTWTLAAGVPESTVRIATRLEQGKVLLSLPTGTVRISGLPAVGLKRNALGAVQADVGGDWAQYVAESAEVSAGDVPPMDEDLALPNAERAAFERLAAELELTGASPGEVIRRVEAHFQGFSYSTFREAAPPRGTTALADFMGSSRSGHCEYFAAATTLLLRAAGVPARYSTGFAMLEYSPLEAAYVVRARHAHAWTRVWVDGRWMDLDTTPPAWFVEEERLAPAWQPLADLLRWAGYRWSQRGELEVNRAWYALLAVLVAALAWRMVRGKRLARSVQASTGRAGVSRPGLDSEFFRVERALAERSQRRLAGEPLTHWVSRLSAPLDDATRERLDRALRLHLRYRFDPTGLDADERQVLCELAHVVALSLEAATAHHRRAVPSQLST